MSWKDLSPEQRADMYKRAGATRRRNAAAKRAARLANSEPVAEDQSLPMAYGSAVEPHEIEGDAPASSIDNPADPFQIWLLALDDETKSLFTPEELRAEFAELWQRAKDEQKKKKKAAARDLALQTARSQLGLLPAQTVEAIKVAQQNAKPVSMMIELPPALDNGDPPDVGLRINGNVIPHGKRWYGTYGEAASYREILYRCGQMEMAFKGNNIRQRSWMMGRAMGSVNTQVEYNEK